ncbi:MAG: ABC transporter ATP-binding protein [Candidatus Polarisedimenticolia bacterium]
MFLQLKDLSKSFGSVAVLRGASLSVDPHRTVAVVGRSGSGKTTLLRIIAGLEHEDAGEVRLDGALLNGMTPERRGVVYLSQEPLLFPHLDVHENVAFGLRLRRVAEAEIRARVGTMLDELGLGGLSRRRPESLSGGQRQRAAFGRALIVGPRLMLLDEPFGALDQDTRAAMQELFSRVAAHHRITSLFVTHDLKEAMAVGDRFAHLNDGALKAYPDAAAFIDDPGTGALAEIRYWTALGDRIEDKG